MLSIPYLTQVWDLTVAKCAVYLSQLTLFDTVLLLSFLTAACLLNFLISNIIGETPRLNLINADQQMDSTSNKLQHESETQKENYGCEVLEGIGVKMRNISSVNSPKGDVDINGKVKDDTNTDIVNYNKNNEEKYGQENDKCHDDKGLGVNQDANNNNSLESSADVDAVRNCFHELDEVLEKLNKEMWTTIDTTHSETGLTETKEEELVHVADSINMKIDRITSAVKLKMLQKLR